MIRDLITRCLGWWANLPLLVRLLLLALTSGGLALLCGKPAYRQFKSWRLERNLVKAREALDEERLQEARDLSLTVLRAGDPRLEAVRILERSAASLKDPRHGDIARALIFHPEGTDDDRLTGFLGVVDRIPLGLLGQVWVSLPAHCQTDRRFAVAFAGRLIKEGRPPEAASVLVAVPETDRDAACERALVRVLIASGRGEGCEEAQRRIAGAISTAGGDQPAWLELLESIPPLRLQAGLLGPARQTLAEDDGARAALMLARMDCSSRFAARASIINGAISRWKDREPIELARFLAAMGLHEHTLETFSNERVAAEPGLLEWILPAARVMGDWGRVKSLLDENPSRLDRLEELAWRAGIASHTADRLSRTEAWSAAMNEAAGARTDDAYLTLHRMAREMRMEDEANQALLAAIRTGRGPLPLYSELKPLLQFLAGQDQERTILEVAAIYLAFEPGNPVLITQYAYLACLNELVEPAMIIKALEPLAKALPKEVPLHCALAAAHLCAGQPGKAAEVLEPLAIEPDNLPPQFRTVLLVTRLLNGKLAKTDQEIRELPWTQLLSSERRKYGDLVRQASS